MLFSLVENLVGVDLIIFMFCFMLIFSIFILYSFYSYKMLIKVKIQTKQRLAKHLAKKIKIHGEPIDSFLWVKRRWQNNKYCGYTIENLLNDKDYRDIVEMAKKF